MRSAARPSSPRAENSSGGASAPLTTARIIGRIARSARTRRPFSRIRSSRVAMAPSTRLAASTAPVMVTARTKRAVGTDGIGSTRPAAVPRGHTDCLRDSTAVTRRTSSRGLNGLIT